MDKADFIRIAPQYYELAVLVAVWTKDGHLSEDSFRSAYEVDHDGNDAETLLSSEAMLATNAWRFLLRDAAWSWPGVRDVTEQLRAVPMS